MKNIQDKFFGFITALFTVLDVLEGAFSYLYLAITLFWEEYGETIKVGSVGFVLLSIDVAEATLLAGRKARAVFDHWRSLQAENAFFTLIKS